MCCIVEGCIQSAPGVHAPRVVPPGQMANSNCVNPLQGKNPMETNLHPETLQRVAMLIQEKAELIRCLPQEVTLNRDHLVHTLECLVDILINRAKEARDMCSDELCTEYEEPH